MPGARVGKFALIKHQRYAHAKQFKRKRRFDPTFSWREG
jgi:predicted TPR repeat methyltransferase